MINGKKNNTEKNSFLDYPKMVFSAISSQHAILSINIGTDTNIDPRASQCWLTPVNTTHWANIALILDDLGWTISMDDQFIYCLILHIVFTVGYLWIVIFKFGEEVKRKSVYWATSGSHILPTNSRWNWYQYWNMDIIWQKLGGNNDLYYSVKCKDHKSRDGGLITTG